MELQEMMPLMLAATTIINLATMVYNILTSTSKKNAAEILKVASALSDHAIRIQSIEGEMKHLPDAKAVMALQLVISDLSGQLGQIKESQSSAARDISLMKEFLLKRPREA